MNHERLSAYVCKNRSVRDYFEIIIRAFSVGNCAIFFLIRTNLQKYDIARRGRRFAMFKGENERI